MISVALILADGFEEIEAVTAIDLLRRAGIRVITVALDDAILVKGSHAMALEADLLLKDFPEDVQGLIIPGGMPGSGKIAENPRILELIRQFHDQGKLLAAICAAPALVFGRSGILKGKKYTCYPGFQDKAGNDGTYSPQRVVSEGNVITACGAGAAMAFAGRIITYLEGRDKTEKVMAAILQPDY